MDPAAAENAPNGNDYLQGATTTITSMVEVLIGVGLGTLLLVVVVASVIAKLDALDERGQHADERLRQLLTADVDTRLRADARMMDVAVVDEHDDGGDVLVPVATVPLSTEGAHLDEDGDPERQVIHDLTADAVREIHPAFADEHVRHYDVRFEFGEAGYGGLGSRECRRMAVPPESAGKLIGSRGYDAEALAEDLREGDDGDDVTPPVYWGECVDYSRDEDAAAATTAATTGGY